MFDYRIDRPVDAPLEAARPDAILLFDGVFLQRPESAGIWDMRVWVDAPFDISVARAVGRDAGEADAAEIRARYEQRYVPGQRMYMDQCRPRDAADIVVNNADLDNPRVQYRRSGRAE